MKYSLKTLYLEDEQVVRTATLDIFEKIFEEILVGEDGQEGLEIFQKNPDIDLVITDINMPHKNGFQAVKQMRDIKPKLHAIFVSGYSFEGFMEDMGSISGINSYVKKPCDMSYLVKIIDNIATKVSEDKKLLYEKNLYQQYQKAISSSTIVSRIDTQGAIIYVNDAFCTITGYQESEILGHSCRVLEDKAMGDEFYNNLWKTLNDGKTFKQKNVPKRGKENHLFYVDMTVVPILNDNKQIVEHLLICHDTTELNKSIIQTKAAKKSQERFLANMSHEIRTPLNGILGFTKILGNQIEDEKLRSYVEIIDSSGNHLLNLINEILDISKLQSGEMKVEKIWFNHHKELSKICSLFQANADEKGVRFHYSICADKKVNTHNDVLLCGDLTKIKQVVANLVNNAIKFTKVGGEVFFDVHVKQINQETVTLEFRVKDTGIGIKKSQQKEIFEPFKQADVSTTREFGGTGLGLSVSKQLIEIMGSNLRLNSKEGKGSEFFFELNFPYKLETKEKEAKEEKSVAQSFKDVTILIAEDVIINQRLMSEILNIYEIDSIFADNGKEAVELFEKNSKKFDMVFLDINMPIMDGQQACTLIKEYQKRHNLSIPVVALTANALSGDKKKYLEGGFDNYISKPIDNEELYDLFTNYLKMEKNHLVEEKQTNIQINNEKEQTQTQDMEEFYENNSKKLQIPKELYKKLFLEFISKLENDLDSVVSSIHDQDKTEVSDLIHRMKGTAGNLRVEPIYKLLKELDEIEFDKQIFLQKIDEVIEIKNSYQK